MQNHATDTLREDAERVLTDAFGHVLAMLARHDGECAGVIVRSCQVCADDPLLVGVAVRKGHAIEPLIRDSRSFSLCVVRPDDKLVMRKLGEQTPPDERTELFASVPLRTLRSGAPVLKRAIGAIDCEVVRHFDLEADCELYVGQVLAVERTP